MNELIYLKCVNQDGKLKFVLHNNSLIFNKKVDEEVFINKLPQSFLSNNDIDKIFFITRKGFYTSSTKDTSSYRSDVIPKRLSIKNVIFLLIKDKKIIPLKNQCIEGVSLDMFEFQLPKMVDHLKDGTIIAAWDFSYIFDSKIVLDLDFSSDLCYTPCDFGYPQFDLEMRRKLDFYLDIVLPHNLILYKTYKEHNIMKLRRWPMGELVNIVDQKILEKFDQDTFHYLDTYGRDSNNKVNSIYDVSISKNDEEKRLRFLDFISGGTKKIDSIILTKPEKPGVNIMNPTTSTDNTSKKDNPNNLCFYKNVMTDEIVQYICCAKNTSGKFQIVYKTTLGEYIVEDNDSFFSKVEDEINGTRSKWNLIDRKKESYDKINNTLFSNEFSLN